MMKDKIALLFLTFFISACSVSDYTALTRAAISKDPSSALKVFATNKSVQYTSNPKKLSEDLDYINDQLEQIFSGLIGAVIKEWGDKNVKLPKKQETVKYLQNYKSRALIDFDAGIVTVETLDEKEPIQSLENAIVTTLLMPQDPRAVDLFSDKKVKLGATPYLLGEVKDDQGKNIRYVWRATRFAKLMIKQNYTKYRIKNADKNVLVHKVRIPMVKDHASVRVSKFSPLIKRYAKNFDISENLVYAIIRTESNFNQFAISNAGAYGLMQIVPSSAGKDAYSKIKGKNWTPTKSYLFDANNNIELGVGYLKILHKEYLSGIVNPISKEYCVIAAYNTGSGNVLRTFHTNRAQAKKIINSKTPAEVYEKMRSGLQYAEARRYLKKVVDFKRDFVGL